MNDKCCYKIGKRLDLELIRSLFLEIKKMLIYRQVDIFCSDEVKFLRNSQYPIRFAVQELTLLHTNKFEEIRAGKTLF